MKKITHWVLGTATARVSGDTARFMNIAVKTGLRPIRLQKDGEDVLFTLYAKDYKKLHKIKQRTHARVKLAEKSGFPFQFRRMLRRPGLLLGTALGVALMLFLSGFYWEMTISGEDIPYAESEILAAAKRVGMYIGAPRSTDTALASVALLEELPELSWASFNTEGCTVQLELRTSVTKAEGAEHDGTGDIVASRAGLIHSITAQNGTVLVKVGSACAAGQVLVSGITQVGDPYDPEYNPVRYFYTRARAEILAETQRTFTASCPLSTETVHETDLGTQRALHILGVRVPLSLSGAPKGQTAYTPARRSFCRGIRCRCGWKRCAYMRRRPCPLRSRRKKRSAARLKICISCKSLRLEKTGVCLRKTSHIRQKTARFTSRPDAYVLKILRRRRRSPCLKSLKIRRL